jgi:LacI family transcriptional regulator
VSGAAERRPGLREVAARAGISISTASRALSGHPDIGAETRQRVHDAVAELGYAPNLLARGLRQGATMTVGFLVRDVSSVDVAEIILGAEVALRERGYSLLLTNSEDRAELDREHIELLTARQVDGLLLLLADDHDEATRTTLAGVREPFVVIDRDLPPRYGASAALVDHRGGVYAAVQHLADLGHRRIGFVGAPLAIRPGREFASALRAAGAELGVAVVLEAGTWSMEFGVEATRRMFEAAEPPTAVLAGSNRVVFGVLQELRSRQLRVPDDVSVIVMDDIPSFAFVDPPLTALSQQPYSLGRMAADLLLQRLAGAEPALAVSPIRMIERASCAPPPAHGG